MDAAVIAAIVTGISAIIGAIAAAIIQNRNRSQPDVIAFRSGWVTTRPYPAAHLTAAPHPAYSANILADYRARMWKISQLLDEIESIRAIDMDTMSATASARRLSSLRGRLRTVWKGVEAACGSLLAVIATKSEIKAWKECFTTVTVNLPIDHQWDNPEEFARARGQIRAWEALIALQQIADEELRAAVGPRRVSKRVLMNTIEALLIAHRVEYARGVKVPGSKGSTSRADIWIPVAHTVIQVRFCRWHWHLRHLRTLIRHNVIAYSNVVRRVVFLVYDRFGIHDPIALSAIATSELLATTYEDISVRIVKH